MPWWFPILVVGGTAVFLWISVRLGERWVDSFFDLSKIDKNKPIVLPPPPLRDEDATHRPLQ